jgi:hypothetical protein
VKIDSLTADMHFTTHQITAEQIMNNQRRDAALAARRGSMDPIRDYVRQTGTCPDPKTT